MLSAMLSAIYPRCHRLCYQLFYPRCCWLSIRDGIGYLSAMLSAIYLQCYQLSMRDAIGYAIRDAIGYAIGDLSAMLSTCNNSCFSSLCD